ncbi:MAG: hypothetical protein V3V00_10850 [Saprospiraceae bacterium]
MKKLNLIIAILNGLLKYSDKEWEAIQSKLNKFEGEMLNNILADPMVTDENIASDVFNTHFKDIIYQRNRKTLSDKLTNEILLFKPSKRKYNTIQRVQYKCEQLYVILKILRGTEYTQLAKHIALYLIKRAEKYHFSEIRVGTNEYLVYYYSFIEPNKKSVDRCNEDLKVSMDVRAAEIFAESNYNVLFSNFNTANLDKMMVFKQAINAKNKLDRYKSNAENSLKFYTNYFSFCVLMHEGIEDYQVALDYARQGYEYLLTLNFDHKRAKIVFLVHMTNCYLRLGFATEARQTILESLKIQIEGENNWFASMWLLVQIELYQNDYDKAAGYYKKIVNNKSFINQPKYRQDQFNIGGAMLYYLFKSNRISKFQCYNKNDFNRSLVGYENLDQKYTSSSIPILIINLLLELSNSNQKSVKRIIDELEQYCSSKVRTSNVNYRTNCFIKMLQCIPEGNFHPVAVTRKAENDLKRLQGVDFKISDEKTVLELIPYERLWEMILDQLKTTKTLKNRRVIKQA